jgi:thioester reductase-like protein
LQGVLPPAAVPARILVVGRFPLTAAGKIDRRALAAAAPKAERTEFVAPQTPLEKLVAATTAEVLGADQVGMHDGFLALGGTSLLAVRAASVLGPRLGRRLRAQIFLEFATLAELCADLDRAADKARPSAQPVHAAQVDAVLALDVVPPSAASRRAPLASVLLTGATGFFGSFLLAELLRETQAHVVCLVRAPSPEAARARTLTSLARRGCAVDPAQWATRVSFVCGDVAQGRLGLGADAFAGLGERVDTIVHVAARVSMLLAYETLKASNALAAEWVLRLASTGRPKTVHHVSTVEVLSDMDRREALALAERPAAASPALLEGGYGQSKWVAEKLIEQGRERGIRAYIHRAGRLTGHSSTGAFNDDDFLVHLLDACGRIGAAPMLDVQVDTTPVDAASRALVRLAKKGPEQDVFHLVHPDPLAWSALLEMAIGLGYPLRLVPHSRWGSMLHDFAERNHQATFLHYLAGLSREEIEASLRGGYETKATSAALGSAFQWPALDASLIAGYLRAMGDAGRFALGQSPRRLAGRSSGKLLASPQFSDRDP